VNVQPKAIVVEHKSTGKTLSKDLGSVWFVAHTSPVKKLAAYYILVYAWFIAKILAANGYPSSSFRDSC
jgi:hypothetical protein